MTSQISPSDAMPRGHLEMPLNIEELDSPDGSLAFRLLLDDLKEMKSKEKGKGKEGEPNDSELSRSLWEQELLAAKQKSEDRHMALSVSNAVATDQTIIAALRSSERVAEDDRSMALSLGGGESAGMSALRGREHGEEPARDDGQGFDTVSEVMGSLMADLCILPEDGSNDEAGPSTSMPPAPRSINCVACLDPISAGKKFRSPCGHTYCESCMRQLFLNATKDEDLYPPRCCKKIIPAGTALRLLSYQELKEFSHKGVECSTVDKVYCGDARCSTFIPPWQISGENATCPTCNQTTHTLCRSLEHPLRDCPSDEQLQQVLSLGESQGWKRCFNCRTMVQLGQGCNHMTCRCGKGFCYICGSEWKTCRCDLWDENRLYGIAQRAVEDEAPRHANVAQRQEALDRAVVGLRNDEAVGCQHERRSQWRCEYAENRQCEACSQYLPEYIFECTTCRMHACNKCIRNRLR